MAGARPNDPLENTDGLITPLPDGRLLIGMAESIFDPRVETYEALPRHEPVLGGAAVSLADERHVLLVGGGYADYAPSQRVATFDVVTHEVRDVAPMLAPRADLRAFLLPSSKVLVVGAAGLYGPANPAGEIYDPASDSWAASAPDGIYGGPESDRAGQTAVQLPNGDVVEFGNSNDCGTYLFDAKTETWRVQGETPGIRVVDAAAVLKDGRVFVYSIGTCARVSDGNNFSRTHIYDPKTNTWKETAHPLVDRSPVMVAALDCGKVAVFYPGATGSDEHQIELYDPATDAWTIAAEEGPWLVYRKSDPVHVPGVGIVTPPGRATWDQPFAVPLLLEVK